MPDASQQPPIASLSVVIPAYQEAARIAPTLARVAEFLEENVANPQILVVDDGSKDDTVAVVRRCAEQIPFLEVLPLGKNRGKGGAVKAGMLAATGDLLLFSDADLSTPIEELLLLVPAIGPGHAVAIGSRALDPSKLEVRQPLHRETMGKIFNWIVRNTLGVDIHDTQCGFKLFTRDAARSLFLALRTEGFAFDVEILYRAHLAGLGVAEIPVRWRNDERSTVHPLRDAARMFMQVLQIGRMVRADAAQGRLLHPAPPRP